MFGEEEEGKEEEAVGEATWNFCMDGTGGRGGKGSCWCCRTTSITVDQDRCKRCCDRCKHRLASSTHHSASSSVYSVVAVGPSLVVLSDTVGCFTVEGR